MCKYIKIICLLFSYINIYYVNVVIFEPVFGHAFLVALMSKEY